MPLTKFFNSILANISFIKFKLFMHSFSYRTTFPTILCDWTARFLAMEHSDFGGTTLGQCLHHPTFKYRPAA